MTEKANKDPSPKKPKTPKKGTKPKPAKSSSKQNKTKSSPKTKDKAKAKTTTKPSTATKSKTKAVKKPVKHVPRKKDKKEMRKHKRKEAGKVKLKKISKKVTKTTTEKPSPTQKPVTFTAGSKEVNLYSIAGKNLRKVKLPIAFDEDYRLDLIRRSVKAARANRRQPYGPAPRAGMSHPSSTWGKGRGTARVQRLVDGRRAVESPNNVGGRRAHPPTVEKIWAEKINRKERYKARRAALAAITDSGLVANRGHKFDKKFSLPLVLEDEFEKVNKTKKALEVFRNLGVYDDVLRAENGKHVRAGRGKSRGRKYRRPKSILIVTSDYSELKKGVGNLIGIDIVTPNNLSVEDLAPGGDPGRLTIITESALKLMGNW
jgi:large subunit ribosomal protein L4e